MRTQLYEFRRGALFILTYHVFIFVWMGLVDLNAYFKLFEPIMFLGHRFFPLPCFLLLFLATPVLYFLVRRFNKKTVKWIFIAHFLFYLVALILMDTDFSIALIAGPYLGIIPVYLILYHRRDATFALGAICLHMFLSISCYLIASGFNLSHRISTWMIEQNGDDWGILALLFDFIARTIIPLIPCIIHLVICAIRRLCSAKKTA